MLLSAALSSRDILVVAFLSILTAVIYYATRVRRQLPYPPGPKPLPLLGNALDIPSTFPWIAYNEFGMKYDSPVVHVTVFGTHIVSVNDYEVAREIFDKKGALNGDRPRLMMLREIVKMDWSFAVHNYGPHWKACRKSFDNSFRPSEVRKMRPKFLEFVQGQMLKRLLTDPGKFLHHCHFLALGVSMDAAYGIHITKDDDHIVEIVERALDTANDSANYQLIDAFPWTRYLPAWFPGMGWKNKVPQWQQMNKDMRNIPFDTAKKAIECHTAQSSLTLTLLEDAQRNQAITEDIIKDTTSTTIAGAVDTTVGMTQTFFLCMILFPDVQQRAQDELDRVVGPGRLPEYSDETRLPYVKAIYKELLRWACVTPLALPHASMEDNIWVHKGKEYFIPKGSIMFANAWAMCRDPKTYPDPHSFNPARFLTKDGKLNPDVPEAEMPFGFRPRRCPGRWFAEDFLFIFIASVLSSFRIIKVDDSLEDTAEWTKLMNPGLVLHPRPFNCEILPRNASVADLVQHVL